jgi:hypothetical protein
MMPNKKLENGHEKPQRARRRQKPKSMPQDSTEAASTDAEAPHGLPAATASDLGNTDKPASAIYEALKLLGGRLAAVEALLVVLSSNLILAGQQSLLVPRPPSSPAKLNGTGVQPNG